MALTRKCTWEQPLETFEGLVWAVVVGLEMRVPWPWPSAAVAREEVTARCLPAVPGGPGGSCLPGGRGGGGMSN